MRRRIINLLAICVVSVSWAHADEKSNWLEHQLPENWETNNAGVDTQPMPQDGWWKSFEDEQLDTLVSQGLANNYDLRIAFNRITSARNARMITASGYYPNIGLNAGYTRSKVAGAREGKGIPSTESDAFSLGATMSWELDIFGKIASQVKEKGALIDVSKADYEGTRLSIAAEIATAYINLRSYQMQLAIAREHLESQKRVMDISQARYDAGLVSKLDVAQARSVYYSTQSSIPSLEADCVTALNSLALLVGCYPDELQYLTSDKPTLPSYVHLIATGVPSDLLRRRPDIIAAEKEIEANAAAVGVAKKDYLPSLTLNGSIGTASKNFDGLFGKHSLDYEIAPTLSWTLFDGFYRKYTLADARIQMQSAIDQYNYTVMNAYMEANNAMTLYKASLQTIESNRMTLNNDAEAFQLSINQYKEGLTSFTNVMNAQLSWLESANTNVSAQAAALENLINLYRALGGTTNP